MPFLNAWSSYIHLTTVIVEPMLLNLHGSLWVCLPGVGLENEGHQGSHFANSKGVFMRHAQLQL